MPIISHKKGGTEGEMRKEKGLGDSLEAFICKDLNFKAKSLGLGPSVQCNGRASHS